MSLSNASVASEDLSIDGFHITWWLNTFNICYSQLETDIVFACWPDKGSYREQDNLTVVILETIREAHIDHLKAEIRRMKTKGKL